MPRVARPGPGRTIPFTMTQRQTIGLYLAGVMLIAFAILWQRGGLVRRIGDPPPPSRVESRTDSGNVHQIVVDVYVDGRPREVRWLVVVPLVLAGVVSVWLLVPRRSAGRQG